MAASERAAKKIKDFQLKKSNVDCFICNSKGANTLIMEFGVFTCQPCSGICRGFGWRAKGVSMSNFTDDEAHFVLEHGNKRQRAMYWACFDPEKNPKIDREKPDLLKGFIEQLLVKKRWHIDNAGRLPVIHPDAKEFLERRAAGGDASVRPRGDSTVTGAAPRLSTTTTTAAANTIDAFDKMYGTGGAGSGPKTAPATSTSFDFAAADPFAMPATTTSASHAKAPSTDIFGFGSAPATTSKPAGGDDWGLSFGSTPAPAPAPAGFGWETSFGAPSTTTVKKSSPAPPTVSADPFSFGAAPTKTSAPAADIFATAAPSKPASADPFGFNSLSAPAPAPAPTPAPAPAVSRADLISGLGDLYGTPAPPQPAVAPYTQPFGAPFGAPGQPPHMPPGFHAAGQPAGLPHAMPAGAHFGQHPQPAYGSPYGMPQAPAPNPFGSPMAVPPPQSFYAPVPAPAPAPVSASPSKDPFDTLAADMGATFPSTSQARPSFTAAPAYTPAPAPAAAVNPFDLF